MVLEFLLAPETLRVLPALNLLLVEYWSWYPLALVFLPHFRAIFRPLLFLRDVMGLASRRKVAFTAE